MKQIKRTHNKKLIKDVLNCKHELYANSYEKNGNANLNVVAVF